MKHRILCLIVLLAFCFSSAVLAGAKGAGKKSNTVEQATGGSGGGDLDAEIRSLMARANTNLEAIGANYRFEIAEYITSSDQIGSTVLFSDLGNKQLPADFVPGDPRRILWSGPVGPGDDITWAHDITQFAPGPGLPATLAAIASAMATWEGVSCSNLPLTFVPTVGNLGFLEAGILPLADVSHAGFGPFFSPPILAATFTATFIAPPDLDNNGKPDVAFREIYYNTFLTPWGINTNFPFDIETVALHEAGHGLSQAHFGKLFQTDANGKFHFAPRAVMNAGYTGVQQQIGRTDNGGHCENWGSWPYN